MKTLLILAAILLLAGCSNPVTPPVEGPQANDLTPWMVTDEPIHR